jgi:adenylate kinase
MEAARYMSAGHYVPDELTIQMVAERLFQHDTAPGFILDGFPRTESQAEALGEILRSSGRDIDLVLALDVPAEEAFPRIEKRSKHGRRADDGRAVALQRQAVDQRLTVPLVERYAEAGVVSRIEGTGSISEVSRRTEKALRNRLRRRSTAHASETNIHLTVKGTS